MRHSAIAAAAFFSFATVAPALTLIETHSPPLDDYNFNTDATERPAVFARSEADFAKRRAGDRFDAPVLLDGPFNSAASDSDFTLSRDGRRAAFWRSLDGKRTLHLAECTARGWSAPTALPTAFDPGTFNFTPHFSADGARLWLASTVTRDGQPAGMADIHYATLPAPRKTAKGCATS